jgi:hypothetical protein
MANKRLGGGVIEAIQHSGESRRRQLLAERGRATHVGEQHRDVYFESAPWKGVTAFRAQIPILARWRESHQAEQLAADTAEGIVTKLATRRSRQMPKQPVG